MVAKATRILHVIPSLQPALGGTVECAKQIANALLRQNCEVEIVCLDRPEADWIKSYTAKVHALGGRLPRLKYSFSPRLEPWLRKNAGRFDAAVVHGLWQFPSYAASRAFHSAGIPYVVYAHGMLMRSALTISPWKLVKKAVYWLTVERNVAKRARAVLFTSQSEREWSNLGFFSITKNGAVIGNGLGLSHQERNVGRLEKTSSPTLLALGRVHPIKRLDYLIRAVAACDTAVKPLLLIAGTGGADYLQYLARVAQEVGIKDKVHFLGHVEGRRKWELLGTSWAVVSTSEHENFCFSIAEGLAVGTPAILHEHVGICRDVQSYSAGLVYQQSDDPKKCAEVIKTFLAMPEAQRAEFQRNAVQCFDENFHIEAVAVRVLNILDVGRSAK